uniref:Uncharacterized protein n=1 Tax=Ananas comosus var. bracteatus TaxID=296719 RepID=A0A6V7QH67_ANACO|nr:unnamed protein product [Ananas comosus var. bracteatus]
MRSAFRTAGQVSTMLFEHGCSKSCSLSHPFAESHSWTTFARTEFRFALMRMFLRQQLEWSNQPVNNATPILWLLWYLLSHYDGSPPSPPLAKLFSIVVAGVRSVMGGRQRYYRYSLPGMQQSELFWRLHLPDLPRKWPLPQQDPVTCPDVEAVRLGLKSAMRSRMANVRRELAMAD